MKAFETNPELKQQLIDAALQHQQLDEYRAGTYEHYQDGKFVACSIGCAIHDVNLLTGTNISTNDHQALADTLGVPLFIPMLADTIFEELPSGLRPAWSARWLSAIPIGADLSLALPRFLIALLDGLPDTGDVAVTAAIAGSRKVLSDWLAAGKPEVDAAWAAARAAGDGWTAIADNFIAAIGSADREPPESDGNEECFAAERAHDCLVSDENAEHFDADRAERYLDVAETARRMRE